MTAINFPDAPEIDDTFSLNEKIWKWNGIYWEIVTYSLGLTGPEGPTGPTGADSIIAGPTGADSIIAGPTGPQGVMGPQGTDIHFIGSVANPGLLPTINNSPNDAYIVDSDGNLHVWSSLDGWVDAGQIVGPEGVKGPTGPAGTSGIISVTGPIVNSGNSTSASLSIQSNPSFVGTVTASSFSGSGNGLTGTAESLTAGSLSGGPNISSYVNMTTISANTNTKIANLTGYSDGLYAIYIHYDNGFYPDGVTNYYWSSSLAGVTGIASAGGSESYYNSSPQQQLLVSGTQHHRNAAAPTFWMYSDSLTANYGNLSLFINVPNSVKFQNLQVVIKKLF